MIRKGTKVEWEWGEGKASGEVKEVFYENVERTIDGKKIKREASKDSPSYLIKQDDDQEVLKSSSEVKRADS